ncbi:Inositol transporter 4 [Glycine max]|nr:Inositol transporter 4 [Glycine max]
MLLTGGQFLSYLINLAFTRAPGTRRWMLGVAGIPALLGFILMLSLPESPRWLYIKKEEAEEILLRIYRPSEIEEEMRAMQDSVETEKEEEELNGKLSLTQKLKGAFKNDVVRRGSSCSAVCGHQHSHVLQPNHFSVCWNCLQLHSSCTVLSMVFIDRYGRRRLMLVSMVGIIVCLVAAQNAPCISNHDTSLLVETLRARLTQMPLLSLHGTACNAYRQIVPTFPPGACLAAEKSVRGVCRAGKRVWFSQGCPSKIGILAVVVLGLYIIAYATGMGTVPWVLNSEIYPLRYRGLGGGIAAVSNWCANLIMSNSFLSMTESLGAAGTFLLFAGFSLVPIVAIYLLVPETKGLQFEEVEKLLQDGLDLSHLTRRTTKSRKRRMTPSN